MRTYKNRFLWVLALLSALIFFSLSISVKAATPYMIKVNKGTNVVTVYKQNKKGQYKKPLVAFVCSTGTATPIGTFPLQYKMRWGLLDGPSYGQYCSVITGNFLFHSVWYHEKSVDSQSYIEYNKLGTTASHGCVRLTTIDAKWIYDNCESGTPVKIFNGNSSHDKLGKPESISLAGYSGWDPTDPDPNNPFKKYFPTISGVRNRKVVAYTKFNPLSGVSALSSNGEDLTKNIRVSGKVKMKFGGEYVLTYSVKDKYHRPTVKKVTITVVDRTKPILKGVNDRVFAYGRNIDYMHNVSAKMKNGTDISDQIVYKTTLDPTTPGRYKVKYIATGTNNKKSSKVAYFTILEPTEDDYNNMIQGVEDRTLTYQGDLSEEEKVSFIQEHALEYVSGTYLDGDVIEPDDFDVVISKIYDNQYNVQYILTDIDGNEITKQAVFTLVHIEEENNNGNQL